MDTKFSQNELDIVKRLTDIKDEKRISVNNIGWTSRTYLVDNGNIVFKFPRTDEIKQDYCQEIDALELIKQYKFDVNIPIINWTTPNNDYIGFYGVEGFPMNQDEISKFNDSKKRKIGTTIGLFLKQLHLINPVKEPYIMTVKDEIEEYQEKYRKSLPTLKNHFSDEELQIIDNLFMKEMPETMTGLGEKLVFCHGDLGYSNILLSHDNKVGIIDFGDAGMYDKSKDFIGLEDEVILESAIISYGDDKTLRNKISIRRKVLPVLDLLYYTGKDNHAGIIRCINLIRTNLNIN